MMPFTILSRNIQGRFNHFAEELNHFLSINSLNIVCIQDLGYIGPDGPIEWRGLSSADHFICNYSHQNARRNVAIILGSGWNVGRVEKSETGGLVAVDICSGKIRIKLICAYMPPGLDWYGKPNQRPASDTVAAVRQREALDSYGVMTKWTEQCSHWIVVGDLNETRDEKLDRSWTTGQDRKCFAKRKFIDEFLIDTNAVDLWRYCYPLAAGHTRTDHRSHATARLDYINCP